MYRSLLLSSCALLAGLAAGCGSLADNTDHHEPLAVLQGELSNPESLTAFTSVRVAVVWNCGDFDGEMYRVSQEVEVQPVFPSRFRLELTEPPPAECMVDPFAENQEPPDDAPEAPGSGGTTGSVDSPPTTPQGVGNATGFRVGIGTIAAYDDLNGNGKLDLVDPGAKDYVDAVLGANESLMLAYFEGSFPAGWDELEDSNGNLPVLGYNLLDLGEYGSAIPESGDVAVYCSYPTDVSGGSDGTTESVGGAPLGTNDADEPVPMPEGGESGEDGGMRWMDAGTFFVLAMTSDPQFASMMCRDGGGFESTGSAGAGIPGAPIEVPPAYPQPDDPGLTCMPDGLSYYFETCVDQGVCRGKMCTGGCWYVPDLANPPSAWPCPIQ